MTDTVTALIDNVERLSSTLIIVVPSLNDYRYSLLNVTHSLDLYPVRITNYIDNSSHDCNSEKEFIDKLREILSSPKVRKALITLKSLSK